MVVRNGANASLTSPDLKKWSLKKHTRSEGRYDHIVLDLVGGGTYP